jgi:GTP-binding protein
MGRKNREQVKADQAAFAALPAPVIVIVGRPNVGKSTLFNRLIGRRRAIVGDEPGITRDRLYGDAEWCGRRLRIVDTGGIIPEDKELIPAAIYEQAKIAMEEAEAVILVVDARSELAAPDLELTRLLHRSGKPLFLAVNKVDTPKMEMYAEEFHRLGIRELYPISAENGTGVAELLEAVVKVLPAVEEVATVPKAAAETATTESQADPQLDEEDAEAGPSVETIPGEIKVAIIGRPNVGKSTLLNALAGEGRAIVSPIPGTTRDAVDELVERDGLRFRFIDTAGIRRKGKTNLMAEKLSVVMARKHLESADIALLVIDASEGISALDATIAGYAHETGRSLIIVINKWDLVLRRSQEMQGEGGASKSSVRQRTKAALNAGHDAFRGTSSRNSAQPADRESYEQQVRESLKFLEYAPMIFVSAASGKNTDKIFPQVELVARERRKRITTGEMNRFLKTVDFDRASVPSSRRVKIYYMTQAVTSPPTFILFTDRKVKLHFAYQRFIENQIRHRFGFIGAPIWIKTRQSE